MVELRAMGTTVTVHAPTLSVEGEAAAAAAVAAQLASAEARFSRLPPDSELAQQQTA